MIVTMAGIANKAYIVSIDDPWTSMNHDKAVVASTTLEEKVMMERLITIAATITIKANSSCQHKKKCMEWICKCH